jgi:predicted ATPase
LRLSGEYEYEVTPLPVPDAARETAADLRRNDAVRLFVERARAGKAGFDLNESNAAAIAAICRRLDGLPLAIELAAARIGLFTPQALLSHLKQSLDTLNNGRRDAPERQQTLRQTIDWSHGLLSPNEQIMFARFAVFAGGCTLDAAERVLNLAPIDNPLDVITALVDKSLVYLHDESAQEAQNESRLMMLQTIRDYALEKLDERGELAALRASHTRYFEQLVHQAGSELNSSTESSWLARLAFDRDNLRAALEWLLHIGQAESAADAAWTLWQFWVAHSNLREWQQWTADMLNSLPSESAARAKALALAGGVAAWQGDYERGVPLLEEGVALFERLGERNHVVSALMTLGIALMNNGDLERAAEVLSRGLAGKL